jgi:CelD/BcsL family acetyltransferase involved in cellulose biosynthesis
MEQLLDHFEMVTDPETLRFLRPEWEELHARSTERRFSQSFVWCWTSWEVVEQPRGLGLICLVGRHEGRVVLIWPFVTHREIWWSIARPLGGAYAEYTYPLVEDNLLTDRRVAAALQALRRVSGCAIIALPCVHAGSLLQRMMNSDKDARIAETVPTFSVDWDGGLDWASYYRSLKGDHRRKLSSKRRQLEQLGKLHFEPSADSAQCVATIDWILRHKVEQLARTGRRAPWLETAAYRNLLSMAAAAPGAEGQVMTFVLKLDDKIIAAQMSRLDARRVEMMNTVFDSTFGKYGPGQILLEACLKWSCDRKLDFDMRVGDFPYKRGWANRACDAITYHVVNTRWGRGYVAYNDVRRRLRQARMLVPTSWRRLIKAALGC